MEKLLSNLIAIISLPLILLNTFGVLVIAVWLAFVGEWSILLQTVFYMMVASFLISLLLLPSMALMPLIVRFSETKNTVGVATTGFLNLLYTYLVIAISGYFVFGFVAAELGVRHPILAVLWAYCVACAPWSYMASKEQQGGESSATTSTLFFAELGFLVVALLMAFFNFNLLSAFTIFAIIMIVPLLLSTISVVEILKHEQVNL